MLWITLLLFDFASQENLKAWRRDTYGDPPHISGKPNAGMILHRIEALGLKPEECAMVGDRLYTDIAMASRAGCMGILVLSGEATMDDVNQLPEGAEQRPSLIVDSVDSLLR